ncbi:hypothetical protein KJ656_04285 [bacterium]|nr:hypothetical protein [bacterium]
MTGRNKEKCKKNRDLKRIVSVHTNFIICTVVLLILSSTLVGNDNNNHKEQNSRPLYKTAGFSEKAVGVMDKGQLQNNTSNFGDLASFHVWFTNAVHWPRTAESNRQYAFGLGLLVAINDTNVIETVTQSRTKVQDWLPPDDAAGRHYSGEVTAVSDETPFMASSDFRETWPYGYYDENRNWINTSERIWPGYYRIDVNRPDFPDTLIEREGEFTSDRDIFCIYNDDYNSRGRVGIEVEQTGYSYGRPYAEDFIFWDMKIHNTSGSDLEDIYIGFYAKFRPDYDNHDYINFIDTDNDGKKDLVYVYDIDNEASTSWSDSDDPLGIVGLRVFDTPNQIGITNFHHFARGVSQTTDEELWALMTSDKSSPHLTNPDYYFHGNDINIDYTGVDSLAAFYPPWSDMEGSDKLEGDAINYIISSGPFTLNAGSMVTISIGLVMGDAGIIPNQPDTSDLMSNVRIANRMHKYCFQGSGPPEPPSVNAVAGDKRVTLFWESEPSENSVDVLSGKKDFEGYKIFRSTDQGRTWGDIITDVYGNTIGYRPIAIFDKVNDIEGRDPAFPQHLGYNTGLTHTYVDSNLINGIEYWYCVTAYDCGNQNPDSLEQSYMYPLGSSIFESHTVSVIPGVYPGNITDASVPQDNLEPIGGISEGVVRVKVIDPGAITGHEYKITFTDNTVYSVEDGDTTFGTGFNLVNITTMDTLLFSHTLSDETGDNLPVIDGFRLTVRNSQMGVKSMSWTKVLGDTCTFDWRYQSKYPGRMDAAQENVSTTDDWRIIVDYAGGLDAYWYDYFTGSVQDEKQHLPIRVEVITDPDNPVDVSLNTWLCEFAIAASWEDYRRYYYSALGWDLVPGGLGYLAGSPGWYEKHVDMLILEKIDTDPATGDTIPNYLYLFTNNKPDSSYNNEGELEIIDSKVPSDGDEFTILTYKPFKPGISYSFSTVAQKEKNRADMGNPLDNVRVVPDPYVVTNSWETNEFGKKLQFNHLPGKCTIKIYTLVGELIATIEHDSASQGYEFWNMRTYNDQFIAPGVYLYYISTPDGDKALGRFLVIR